MQLLKCKNLRNHYCWTFLFFLFWINIDTPNPQDIDETAMELLIDFCYTSSITVEESNVQTLLPAACLLQVYCSSLILISLHSNFYINIASSHKISVFLIYYWVFSVTLLAVQVTKFFFVFLKNYYEVLFFFDHSASYKVLFFFNCCPN